MFPQQMRHQDMLVSHQDRAQSPSAGYNVWNALDICRLKFAA